MQQEHTCFQNHINKCASYILDVIYKISIKSKPTELQCNELLSELYVLCEEPNQNVIKNYIFEKLCNYIKNRAAFSIAVLKLYAEKKNIKLQVRRPPTQIPDYKECLIPGACLHLKKGIESENFCNRKLQHEYTLKKSKVFNLLIILISNLINSLIPIIQTRHLQLLLEKGTEEQLDLVYNTYDGFLDMVIDMLLDEKNASAVPKS